jgi:DNA-binding NarL/FixJ family response regulator
MECNLQSTIKNKCSESQASSAEFDRDAKFLAMLPRIRRQAGYCLRHVSKKDRAEAVQEVVARSFVTYLRLIERGKADVAYAGPLARYAACQYLAGRRIGNRMNSHDVTSAYCQQRKKIMVEQLDHFDEPTSEWEQLVVEDRHSTPADVAATRVDFRDWLESLPVRTRHVAETLATGEATKNVARMFGCSASRISQLRRELFNAWQGFQREGILATSSLLA